MRVQRNTQTLQPTGALLRKVIGLLLSSAFMSCLTGCLGCSPNPEAPRPNFVLIMVDALRADRFSSDEPGNGVYPNFGRLQNRSTRFSNAYSTCSWTIPSVSSLFLSQYVSVHKIAKWGSLVSSDQTTFVEILRAAGYRTGGWTANRLMSRKRGLAQGFEDYQVVMHPRWKLGVKPGTELAIAPASSVIEKAIAWLVDEERRAPDAPFFAYLHFMEPHTPYLCPETGDVWCHTRSNRLNRRLLAVKWKFNPEQQAFIQKLYNDDVARMDTAFADLWEQLEKNELLENTWVILTADHGELLGEHGLYIHGNTLYQPLIRVPLVFSPPSRDVSDVETPVSLIDVAPTILDLAGIEVPPSFQGRSLRPALEGQTLRPRPVVSELLTMRPKKQRNERHRHLLAVVSDHTKYLKRVDGVLERYDLIRDPEERDPLTATNGELAKLLAAAGIRSTATGTDENGEQELSPETIEELKALGYLQ